MAKTLVLDWDESCLRYLIADRSRRGQPQLLASEEVRIESMEQTDEPRTEPVVKALSDIVSTHKLQKAEVIVGIGRGDVKTSEFMVPEGGEKELPMMVRNLALRDFPSLSDDSALDFVASPANEDGTRRVVAMLLPAEDVTRIREICESAGVQPTSVRMRPLSLSVFSLDSPATTLTASLGGSRLDVLVSSHQVPIAARTLRIPQMDSVERSCQFTVQELRRTLLSVSAPGQNFDPTSIERLVVFESIADEGALRRELTNAFDVMPESVDPLSGFDQVPEDQKDSDRFAALVGLLLQDTNTAFQVDFLNPRRPPAPVNRRKPVLIGLGVVATLLFGVGYYIMGQLSQLDDENLQLTTQLNELKKLAKDTEPKRRTARSLTAWEKSRVVWLDELRDLTLRVPGRGRVQVSRLTISPSRGSNWSMTFDGVARDAATVRDMEDFLRAANYIVRTPTLREQSRGKQSVWSFQTTITLKPRSSEEYLASFKRLGPGADGAPQKAEVTLQKSDPAQSEGQRP